tara:strand:+ start:217 stop:996 length:780 start_codon:yes stop_codon:yes gene_type:complete
MGCRYNTVFEFSQNLPNIPYGPDQNPIASIKLEERKYMECRSKLDLVKPESATIIFEPRRIMGTGSLPRHKQLVRFGPSFNKLESPSGITYTLTLEIEEDKGERQLNCVDNDPQTKDCAGCECDCVAGPGRKTWGSTTISPGLGFLLPQASEISCHPPADCECLWDATEDPEINDKLGQLLIKLANNGSAATAAAIAAYDSCKTGAGSGTPTWEKELLCRQAGLDAAAKELDKDGALSTDLKELGCPNHEGSNTPPSWK